MRVSKVKILVKIIKVTTLEPKVTLLSAHCALFISSFYMGHEALPHPRITFEPHSTQESQWGLLCSYPLEETKAQTRQIAESIKMADVRITQPSLLANCFSPESIRRFLVASSKMAKQQELHHNP